MAECDTSQSTNSQKLRIVRWNANGILSRKGELLNFLELEDIDIALISETHLTPRNCVKFKGYRMYCCHHPGNVSHGGSAVLIERNLTHYELNHLARYRIRAMCVAMKFNGALTTVASIYRPSRHIIFEDEYTELFRHLGQRWLAGGDWNAKHMLWGSRLISPKGCNLHNSMVANDVRHTSSRQPTYWPADTSKIPDCIDFFLTKNVAPSPPYARLSSVTDLSSVHSPIVLELNGLVEWVEPKIHLTSKSTDWDIYRDFLRKMISLDEKIRYSVEIDAAVADFTDKIKQPAIATTPVIESRQGKTKRIRQKIWAAVNRPRNLQHRWQLTRDPLIKREFIRVNTATEKLLSDLANKELTNFLLSLHATKDTNFPVYRVTRAVRGPLFYNLPLHMLTGNWARTDLEKATTLATHPASTFQTHDIQSSLRPNSQPAEGEKMEHISPMEVEGILDKLNPRKAPRMDSITASMLKELPQKAVCRLVQIFNAILRTRHFSKE